MSLSRFAHLNETKPLFAVRKQIVFALHDEPSPLMREMRLACLIGLRCRDRLFPTIHSRQHGMAVRARFGGQANFIGDDTSA